MNLKTTTIAAVTASAAIAPQAAGAPSSAPAAAPTPKHARQYLRAYHAVARKFGHRAPGRNIVRWGLRGRKATDRDLTRSLTVLQRMLAPPRPSSAVSAGVRAVSTGVATLSAGAAGVPACASESGSNYSTGPSNTNPSGATGRYQIMPFHWSTDCKGLDTSPAGQDACAAIIYRNSGAGAWVGCGG